MEVKVRSGRPRNISDMEKERVEGRHFWIGHHSLQTWILLNICGEISDVPYMSKNISELENSKSGKVFTSCYSCPRRQGFAQGIFLFWNLLFCTCKIFYRKLSCFQILRNLSCLTLYPLEVRFASVHLDINCKRLFDQGCPKTTVVCILGVIETGIWIGFCEMYQSIQQ